MQIPELFKLGQEKHSWKEKASKIALRATRKTSQRNSVEETRPARTSHEDPRFRLLGDFEQIKLIEQLGAGNRLSFLKSRNQRGNYQNNLICRNKLSCTL